MRFNKFKYTVLCQFPAVLLTGIYIECQSIQITLYITFITSHLEVAVQKKRYFRVSAVDGDFGQHVDWFDLAIFAI